MVAVLVVVKVVKVKIGWVIERKCLLLREDVVNVLFAQQIIDDVDQTEEFEGDETASLYISGAAEAQ